MRILFDVTDLTRWNRPPVGIIRVELEMAKYILQNIEIGAYQFVSFSADKNSLNSVNAKDVAYLIKEIDGTEIQTAFLIEQEKIQPNVIMQIKKKYYHWRLDLKNDAKRFIQRMVPLKYHSILIKISTDYQAIGLLGCAKKYLSSKLTKEQYLSNRTNHYHVNVDIKDRDIFIIIGFAWSNCGYELCEYIKKTANVSLVGISYDMIPITHPEYVIHEESRHTFQKHFEYLTTLFSRIAFISVFSKKQFEEIMRERKIKTIVSSRIIYLGESLVAPQNHTSSDANIMNKPYVLFVSTVEIRKNHIVLLKAWLEAQSKGIEMPNLICVGLKSSSMDSAQSLLNANNHLKKKVTFLNRVNNEVLADLYRNCLFTVFPSHVEGWGLGAVESLAYGKICIISTAEALEEATRHLMPSIDPNDVDSWMQTISHLALDAAERARLELKIKQEFHPRSWETFAKEFIDFAIQTG